MLQSIRENIKGVGAWVIILFLCIPFAFWGINQYFDPVAQDAVASVNGEDISSFEVEQAYQQRYQQLLQAFGDQLPPDLINEQALRREQLNQLILQELLRQKLQEMGYRASNDQVRDMIRGIPAFQQDGKFSTEQYRRALLMAGRSPAAFEQLIRRDIALQQLQQAVSASEFATPFEAAFATAIEEQGRRHSAVVINDEPFRQQVEITEGDLREHYEQNLAQYMTQEKVDLAYVEMSLDRFAQDVEVTEEALQELYSQRAGQFASEEERRARHILVEGDGDAARAKAEEALERIQAGEDFAAVAREVSDDPVSAEEGGDLGYIQRGQLSGGFEDALFSLEVGEMAGPVKSDFGYHLIKLDEIKAPELPDFAEIRDELAREYRERQARQMFENAIQQLADATFQHDGSLDNAASELGLEIKQVEGVTQRQGKDIAASEKVRQAAFSETVLEEGLNSDPIYLDDDRVIVVRVAGHQPAEPKPLNEVEEQVRQSLIAERARRMAREKANAVLERARGGESLAGIAASEGLIHRDESVTYRQTPDIGPAYAEALFNAQYPGEGATYAMTPVENDDFVVFLLTEVIHGRYDELSASERESQQRQLRQRVASVMAAAYVAEMRANADIVIQEKNLEQE